MTALKSATSLHDSIPIVKRFAPRAHLQEGNKARFRGEQSAIPRRTKRDSADMHTGQRDGSCDTMVETNDSPSGDKP